MNVSLNWLSERLDLTNYTIQQIEDLLTFSGVEVENISPKGIPSEKIVVAEIKEALQHPNADKLKVTQVDTGEGALRQIICGAQNYKVGDKVPCCLPGASLGDFTIGETKMRGIESRGMLAAASEIGLPDSEDGLMILPPESITGTPLTELYESDTIIEVEITPNRPDLLSHSGMARELGALIHQRPQFVPIQARETADAEDTVKLLAEEQCPFYSAVKISGIQVAESPQWLKSKLLSIGLTPINNVVDVTNYALHELGHPLHAFDAEKVTGNLTIRLAQEKEEFTALDGSKHRLLPCDLVISDQSQSVLALAGIIGGLDSGVTESTQTILLESAYFQPSTIRRSSRRTAVSSDSSYRFERGTDPQQVLSCSHFAAQLIAELTGGSIEGPTRVAGSAPILNHPVELELPKFKQLVGESISEQQAELILSNLGLEKESSSVWNVPSYRLDLTRHIDLVEEIVRVHGLDKIQSRFAGSIVEESEEDRIYDYQLSVKKKLAALGFYEIQGMKLIAESTNDQTIAQIRDALPLRPLAKGDLIKVSLPLSEDHAIMRPSLVPSLISTAARNLRQGAKALRFFEIGKQFRNAGGGKAKDLEADSLAILIGGALAPASWNHTPTKDAELFDLKAVLEILLPKHKIQLQQRDREGFIIAADVLVNAKPIGIVAQLSPSRCREIDSVLPIYVAEIDIKKMQLLASKLEHVRELPQFPASSRDAAMEVPLSLKNGAIEKLLSKFNEPLLESYFCFDVFSDPSGKKLSADKKSIAYSFTYRDSKRTLKAKEVDQAHQNLLDHLSNNLEITFR